MGASSSRWVTGLEAASPVWASPVDVLLSAEVGHAGSDPAETPRPGLGVVRPLLSGVCRDGQEEAFPMPFAPPSHGTRDSTRHPSIDDGVTGFLGDLDPLPWPLRATRDAI